MSPPCFWYLSQNFGDALNVNLVTWITGGPPSFVSKESPSPWFMLCGSILSQATEHSTVWGAGIGSMNEIVNPRADLRAVRGPLSHWRATKSGARCPKIFGDPALLLPRFYQPRKLEPVPLGIVPHYVDQERARMMFPGAHIINVLDDPLKVIDDIARCGAIASSALHGLIVATAYGIPSRWLHMNDLLFGDGSKFFDFYESCGVSADVLDLRFEQPSLEELTKGTKKVPLPDLEPLWNACPLR